MAGMRKFIIVFGFGLVGVLVAAIIQVLHVQSIVIDDLITGSVTLPEVMAVIIIIHLLIGVGIASAR